MKLYSYVVARDYGFAPNPFYGYCTLATCKPDIRAGADVGDWIVGTGSHKRKRGDRIVFAMRVTEALTFGGYWADPRFRNKRPYLVGSKKQAFGDNIYFKDNKTGKWRQENSHHSRQDGRQNASNIARDTRTDRVLISSDYVYWGGSGPKIPSQLCSQLCKRGPGHKCNFPDDFVAAVVEWIKTRNEWGYAGEPLDWVRTP